MKKSLITLLAASTFLALPVAAVAADLPGYSATYRVSADGKTGTATRTLTKTGNNYKYTVNARAAGVATLNQEATFSLSNGRILPSSSTMSARILGIGNTHSVRFNNAGKSVVSTYKGKATTLNMPRQAYDDLSLEAQIRQELINGKFSGSYQLVKKTEIETTKFRRAGNTKITVPAGTYDTVRIDRIHDDRDRATSFWLAPSLDYLPVRVSQTTKGKIISMELTKIN
ncbi:MULTISPECIES: DUF3108 domain-containing protein [Moraxella]|uniref:DUF3108 domain-containing protein n=1 Tax=Moraxella catarrhalis TaxID=480 RepID=A0A7Z1A2R8_MORCA|nr:DUF3108 domain-containing protein [Moraxella catarrhalis]OAU98933.1 hypothetical protein AO382_2199 [Moraxella catarrhalis]STY82461.1 Protein of uncharacterised function (DUF3108) [Moraxella catarrhalis]